MDNMRPLITRLTEKNAIIILTVLYVVGTCAFALKIHPDFTRLTPFNLLISLLIALFFHEKRSKSFTFFAIFCAIVGFVIEMIGVNTGLIFGHYTYDYALGFELFNTPLSISINWVLTTYCAGAAVLFFLPKNTWWLNALLSALLMVLLDVFIEPVAMKTGMWSWQNDRVPFQNYVGWFGTALPLQLVFFGFGLVERNKVAVWLLILQFLFFAVLGFFL